MIADRGSILDILASGNLNSRNVETGVPEHGNRLDWLNGFYQVQLVCQAQSRFAVRSRLYD